MKLKQRISIQQKSLRDCMLNLIYNLYFNEYSQLQQVMSLRHQSHHFMEEAIDKASNLIGLLTNENQELKMDNLKLHEMMNMMEQNNEDAVSINIQLNEQNQTLKKQLETIKQKEINRYRELEEIIEQKTKKNKQLHEKIGQVVSKNQQLTKKFEKQQKRNMSLQNQNQYLMKIIDKKEMQQNNFQNYCEKTEDKFKKQMVNIQRTKQAFSRRCEQMKIENQVLKDKLFIYTQQIEEIRQKEEIISAKLVKFYEMESQIIKINEALTNLIDSGLNIKSQSSALLKIDQIKNYLVFRLSHLESIMQPLHDWMTKQGITIEDFKSDEKSLRKMNSIAGRLSLYLSQLVK